MTDEGDMFPLDNGKTLERGEMVNPWTGRVTPYEECWKDVTPLPTTTETIDSDARAADSPRDGRVCLVLRLHDESHQARGLAMRVGQFCQGILRSAESFSLEQWAWEASTGWKRNVRMGDYWLPCAPMLKNHERLQVGQEVKQGEFVWHIIEKDVY